MKLKNLQRKTIIKIIVISIVFLVIISILFYFSYIISMSMKYRPSMRALAELTVPNFEFVSGETAWLSFHFESRDIYGRCMFSVSDQSTGKKLALIIVQINDSNYNRAYYYNGFSTLLLDDKDYYDFSDVNDELIEHLKDINDWNKPLNYYKMDSVAT